MWLFASEVEWLPGWARPDQRFFPRSPATYIG